MTEHSRIELMDFSRSDDALFFHYRVGPFRFNNTFWYRDCHFPSLEESYGTEFMHRIYFHVGAFEINKLVSLNAPEISFGPFDRFVTPAFVELWTQIVHGVWAQWRYENNLPQWTPPSIVSSQQAVDEALPATVKAGESPFLAFCGGGKDSALVQCLLAGSGANYETFVYANSVYGRAQKQFEIIERLLAALPSRPTTYLQVSDDFLEAPLQPLREAFHISSVTAAETPSSIFEAIPLALQRGYTHIVLGHEKSADVGNLIWNETGEDVNHQWGKSSEAEELLSSYLKSQLVSNLDFFSILKPIHDVVIFGSLRDLPRDAILATHSCNIDKPWCKRCAKCVYVWLNYLAYLDADIVSEIFDENLFDVEDNFGLLTQLIGLTDATPFECIGEADESMLALALCKARGYEGAFLDNAQIPADLSKTVMKYTKVDSSYSGMPQELASVIGELERSAASTRSWIIRTLQQAGDQSES